MVLLDTHYHFDFIESCSKQQEMLSKLRKNEIALVAQTVKPSDFGKLLDQTQVLPSLGFHPWWIQSKEQVEAELQIFAKELNKTSLIGEIGLDFSPKCLQQVPKDLQLFVLKEIIEMLQVNHSQQYILSIHTVRSASQVLEVLAKVDDHIVPIFHRFNGTSQELTQLIRLGGYVSIHPQMFASKKGRAYIQQVPADKILLESDLPEPQELSSAGVQLAVQLQQTLTRTLAQLSDLRQEDMKDMILANQIKLYGIS